MITENFVFLGLAINLIGGLTYLIDTVKGKIQPNRVSWGLWSLAVYIGFFAELKQGVGIQSWAIFATALSTSLVFFASFVNKKAYWKLTSFDYACGAFSIIGILLWIITKNPNLAIIFSIFADLMAGIPTLIKSYHHPETESSLEYTTSAINIVISLLTLKLFNFASLTFPLYILAFDLASVLLIQFKLGKLINSKGHSA